MAHAHADTYNQPAVVRIDVAGEVSIYVGGFHLALRVAEAEKLEADLKAAIAEAQQVAA